MLAQTRASGRFHVVCGCVSSRASLPCKAEQSQEGPLCLPRTQAGAKRGGNVLVSLHAGPDASVCACTRAPACPCALCARRKKGRRPWTYWRRSGLPAKWTALPRSGKRECPITCPSRRFCTAACRCDDAAHGWRDWPGCAAPARGMRADASPSVRPSVRTHARTHAHTHTHTHTRMHTHARMHACTLARTHIHIISSPCTSAAGACSAQLLPGT